MAKLGRIVAREEPRRAGKVAAQLNEALEDVERLRAELFALDAADPALAEVTAAVKRAAGEEHAPRWWTTPASGLQGAAPRDIAVGSQEGAERMRKLALQIANGTSA